MELDRDGQIVARQFLDLARPDVEDGGLDDFAEEQPLVYVDPYAEGARPAPLCGCPDPLGHDGLCVRCGRTLSENAEAVRSAA